MKRYRTALITKQGDVLSNSLDDRKAVDDWILSIAISKGVKRADIVDRVENTRDRVEEL